MPIDITNPPNFHAMDYWGQIGGRLHPETKAPIGGVIYDCNQHGHSLRPYIPPRQAQPNITWTFYNHDWPKAIQIIACSGLADPGPETVYIGLSDDQLGYRGSLSCGNWQDPTHGDYGATLHLNGDLIRSYAVEDIDLYHEQIAYALHNPAEAFCYIYPNFDPPIDPTAAQLAQRATHRDRLDAWLALSASQKALWRIYARRFRSTGIAAFLHIAAQRARHGLPAVAVPP